MILLRLLLCLLMLQEHIQGLTSGFLTGQPGTAVVAARAGKGRAGRAEAPLLPVVALTVYISAGQLTQPTACDVWCGGVHCNPISWRSS
jgi:hypothetical protein